MGKEAMDVKMKLAISHHLKDPGEWLMSLKNIKWKFRNLRHNVIEGDMMVHVLYNLPNEYENTIEIMENELKNDKLSQFEMKERQMDKLARIDTNEKGRRVKEP
jgi:hypothetical protein